jgi:hypothetical protein
MNFQKIINKKGLLMRDYVIILVFFSLFVGISGLIVSDLSGVSEGYNISNLSEDSFDDTYNKMDYVNDLSSKLGNSTTSKEGLTILGTIDMVFGSTLTVIQLVGNSFSVVRDIFTNMVSLFGIPVEIGNILFGAILSIIIIIIAFVIISSLTKTKM